MQWRSAASARRETISADEGGGLVGTREVVSVVTLSREPVLLSLNRRRARQHCEHGPGKDQTWVVLNTPSSMGRRFRLGDERFGYTRCRCLLPFRA